MSRSSGSPSSTGLSSIDSDAIVYMTTNYARVGLVGAVYGPKIFPMLTSSSYRAPPMSFLMKAMYIF